ncbi:MAG: anti-sigma F factor [Bacillota bacterium]|nr:anti-sigma F factor [Bacillota bacterium]
MKVRNYIKLEFPALSINESFARSATAGFVAQLDPTLEELDDIKTAVSEAVTNCIVHAYPDSVGKISLRLCIYEGGGFEIRVRDWGKGIENIDMAMQPMYTTGGEDRSGMGFTIMESFMDMLSVSSAPGKGTTVVMQRVIKQRESRR